MKKLSINLRQFFPAAVRRVEILRELRKNWASVVGPALVRHSFPCNLGVDELTVAVENKQTAIIIARMKGNITRALTSRYDYDVNEKFIVKIVAGAPNKIKKLETKRASSEKISDIKIDEEEVRQYMQGAPETLPEDINYAISHLQAFFDVLFPDNKRRD